MNPPSPSSAGLSARLPALDGLRGLAILMVLVHHVCLVPLPVHLADRLIERASRPLWIGVDLLFVLSGFLITRSLLETMGRPGWLGSFFLRRSLRVLPLYFLSVLLFLVVLPRFPWSGFDAYRSYSSGEIASFFLVYLNYFYATTWPAGNLGHFWSLCIEIHFYLVWPFLVLWGKGRLELLCKLAILAVTFARIGAIATGYWTSELGYHATHLRLDAPVAGALAYLVLQRCQGDPKFMPLVRRLLVPCACVAAGFLIFGRTRSSHLGNLVGFPFVGATICLFLLLAVKGEIRWLDRILTSRFMVWNGKLSYALYVFHFPAIYLAWQLFFPGGEVTQWKGMVWPFAFLSAAVAIPFSYFLAWASGKLIEGPCQRLARSPAKSGTGVIAQADPPVTEANRPSRRNEAIDIARLVAAVLIVLYHAAQSYSLSGGADISGWPPWAIIGTMSLWGRVPFFFFLAGWLASMSLGKPQASGITFAGKKLKSLGIPYLFWNLVSLAILWAALVSGWLYKGPGLGAPEVLMQLSGFGMSPANGPLWFVRDLILASLAAPLMMRLGPWLLLPCLALTTWPEPAAAWQAAGIPLPSSFGYFGLGMLFRYLPAGSLAKFFPRPGTGVACCLLAGLLVLVSGVQVPPLVGPAVGAAGILLTGQFIRGSLPALAGRMADWSAASFILFAANVPFFAMGRTIYSKLPEKPPAAVYFSLLACAFLFLGIAAHRWLRDHYPGSLKILSGGR